MAGVLDFTLGIEATQFLNDMGLSAGAVLTMTTAAQGLSYVMEHIFQGIEVGGRLNDLGAKMSETAGTAFQLQVALEQVGGSGDSIVAMVIKLHQSLSGLTDTGENTSELLAKIGVDMGNLKSKGAVEQIETIAAALKKLPREDQASIGSKLFGREGAQNILAVTADLDGFRESIRQTSAEARVFDRVAKTFDYISDTLGMIKAHYSGMWAAIAEGIAPLIKNVEDFVNKIDFVEIGENIGDFIAKMNSAMKQGRMGDLLKQGFAAAIEYAVDLIANTLGKPSFWEGIATVMVGSWAVQVLTLGKMFVGLGAAFAASIDTAIQSIFEKLSGTSLGKFLGIPDVKAKTFDENFDDRKKQFQPAQDLLTDLTKAGMEAIGIGMGELKDVLANAIKNSSGPEQEKFKAMLNSLPGIVTGEHQLIPHAAPDKNNPTEVAAGKSPDVSALEKIGFVFGNGSQSNDYQRQTVAGIAALTAEVKKLPQGIANILPSGKLVNQ